MVCQSNATRNKLDVSHDVDSFLWRDYGADEKLAHMLLTFFENSEIS